MTTFRQLRDNLVALIQSIDGIQEVSSRPTLEFKGYPAAFVVPADPEANFLTTNENERTYGFKVWLFSQYDVGGADQAFNELMDRAEDILNKVDKEEDPDTPVRSMATGLGNGVTLIAVLAALGRVVPDEAEKVLGFEVTVRCKTTVDITTLS